GEGRGRRVSEKKRSRPETTLRNREAKPSRNDLQDPWKTRSRSGIETATHKAPGEAGAYSPAGRARRRTLSARHSHKPNRARRGRRILSRRLLKSQRPHQRATHKNQPVSPLS